MTNMKDLKDIFHGPVATAEREKREKEVEDKRLEEKRARREKAVAEVDKILRLCREAAEHGYRSCSIEDSISEEAKEILREKEIKFGVDARQSGCTATFFGWGN